MKEKMLSVKNLSLSYHDQPILADLNFHVSPGEIVGYLGANGAGKSTTIKTILGLNPDYHGQIEVFGQSIEGQNSDYKKRIGYVPEQAVMYDELSAREYLSFAGSLYGLPEAVAEARALRLLSLLNMADVFDQRIDSFSKGMRQKVLIVSSLLHNPDILFLDEPLNGLDIVSVSVVRAILRKLADQGKVIFFSSHILEVVENIADRILILENGQISLDQAVAQMETSVEKLFHQTRGASIEGIATEFVQSVTSYQEVGRQDV